MIAPKNTPPSQDPVTQDITKLDAYQDLFADKSPYSENQKEYLRNNGIDIDESKTQQLRQDLTDVGYKSTNPFKTTTFSYNAADMGYMDLHRRSAFKRLGFNPLIDNYKKYGEETTDWEKLQDSWQAHWNLHNDNFTFFGFGGQDNSTQAAAMRYEGNASLGTPIGSNGTYDWALTQFANAGYTTAIISSIAAEELTMAAATALTGGGAGGGLLATTARNVDRLSRLNTVRKGVANGAKTIKNLKDVGSAKSFFNAAKSATGKFANKAASKTGNFLFPSASNFIKRAGSKGDDAIEGMAYITEGFGGFYREIREFNLAFDESDLEASFATKETMSALVDQYKKTHNGEYPEGEELNRLLKLSKDAGDATFAANATLIYATNKIGFGGMFTRWSSKAAKRMAGASIIKIKANLGKGVKAQAKLLKDGFWNNVKFNYNNIRKNPGLVTKRAGLYALKSTSSGASEGFQEYSQEVIGDAEKIIAVDKYSSASKGSKWDIYANTMKKYISPEGAEVFVAGFAMGAFAGPHRMVTTKLTDAAVNYSPFLTGNLKETQARKKKQYEQMEEQVEKLNDMFSNPTSRTTGLGSLMGDGEIEELIKDQAIAKENGDKRQFKNISDEISFETLFRTIGSGGYELLIDQMEQMQTLSDDEIKEAFANELPVNPTKEDITKLRKETELVAERAEYIKNSFEKSKEIFVNPFDQNSNEIDTQFGVSENILHNAYEAARSTAIRNEFLFMETLKRKQNISEKFVTKQPFWRKDKSIPMNDLNLILNKDTIDDEIVTLGEELKSMNGADKSMMTSSQKKSIKDKTKKLELLKALRDDSTEFRKALTKIKKESLTIRKNSKVTMKNGTTGTVLKSVGKGEDKRYQIKKDNGKVAYFKAKNVELHEDAISEKYEKAQESKLKSHAKNYKAYLTFLANTNDNTLDEKKAADSFQDYIDYHVLTDEEKTMEKAANILNNPERFYNEMLREAAIREEVWKDKKEILRESLAKSQEAKDISTLNGILAEEHNAFIEEEALINLLKDEGIPMEYYDINSLKPIDQNSKRYFEIATEIQNFIQQRFERVKTKTEYKLHDILTPEDFTSETDIQDTVAEVAKRKKELRSIMFIIKQIDEGNMEGDREALLEEARKLKDYTIYITKLGATNEDGTVEAEISLNGKKVDVTLNALENAIPEAPVKQESTEPITIDTPFEEWPEELQTQLNELLATANDNLDQAGLDPIEVNEFLESTANKRDILNLINDFYKVEKEEEEEIVSDPESTATETEEETEEAAGETEPSKPKPTQMEVEMEGLSEEEKRSINNEDSETAEIEIELDDVLLKSIMDGETGIIATSLTGDLINEIITKLNEANPGKKIDSLELGQKVFIIIEDGDNRTRINLTSLYEMTAKKFAEKMGSNISMGQVAMTIGAQSEPKGNYVVEVTLDGNTYYVKDNLQKLWLEGNGELSILTVDVSNYNTEFEDLQTMEKATQDFEKILNDGIAEIKKNPGSAAGILSRIELAYEKMTSDAYITPKLNGIEVEDFEYISAQVNLLIMTAPQAQKTQEQMKMESIGLGLTYEYNLNGETVHAVAESRVNDVITFRIGDKAYDVSKKDIMKTIGKEVKGVPPVSFDVSSVVEENDESQEAISTEDVNAIKDQYKDSSTTNIEDDMFDELDEEQKNC